jgi:hypothetical protein
MRYIGLAAFGATTSILVPLAVLDAGPTERAKLMAADTHDLVVNGAHVTATLEHPFADPDSVVHLTLTSDKKVELGIVVMGSTGTEGERVPSPPRAVAHRNIELVPDKATGTATKDVAIRLHNARVTAWQPYGSYTFYVMSEKAGDRLQALVDRAGPSIPTGEIPDMDTDTSKLFEAIYKIASPDDTDTSRDAKLFAKGSVGVVTAFTRPVQDDVKLAMPDRVTQGESFAVTVTVHNPHAQRLSDVTIQLEPMTIGDSWTGMVGSDIAIEKLPAVALAPGERKTVQFHVTAPYVGVLGLHASATCESCRDLGNKLAVGTFDAVEIVAGDTTVAARR